ncbi:MAG: HEAT repeat domain-containing protein [Alphaproteobacteria bacterium]|nr:HEAT repeat domain-containing protein [Alphaproteobacteria bacterium]
MNVLATLLALSGLSPLAHAGGWMGGPAAGDRPLLQPDALGAAAPDRSFDLQQLQLDLDLHPDTRSVSGTVVLTLSRLWEGPVVLDQAALDIRQVSADGAEVAWRTQGEQLIIDVAPTFGADAPGTVAVTYAATPRTGLHFREAGPGSPDSYAEIWSQGEGEDNRYWLPTWDHPNDRFVYQGTVRGPDGWQVLTNSGHDMVSYLIMVAAGPYEIVAHDDAPDVTVWLPPGTDHQALARVLDPVPAMMAHMGERTGVPYAWGSYRQVFVQRFMYTGMENTSATINHERLLVDDRSGRSWDGPESVVAHELAHQWYGDLLTCEGWRELWLNEGFASFMAADWLTQARGEAWYAEQARGWLDGAQNSPRPLTGRFFQGPDAPPNHNVYGRGAAVLHMLRVYLGEERFWAGIRRYTQGHQRQLVHSRDLQAAMEEVSGRELDWFFQQWVELGFVPELTVTRRYADGRLSVTVRQQGGEDRPQYTLPITVEVGTADGQVLRRTGWLTDEATTLEWEIAEAPRFVAFDPDGAMLAHRNDEQEPDAWIAQLGSPSPMARLVAIRALGETDRSEPLAALLADRQAAQSERAAAATALGAQRAQGPLLAALDDPDGVVRKAVARALGDAVDRAPAAALIRTVQRDADPGVQREALTALARVDADRAVGLARELVVRKTDREGQWLWAGAAEVLGEHGEPRDLGPLLATRLPARLRHDGTNAAARIAAREEGDKRERLEARVARAVEPMLDDLDLRGRQHAIGLLGRVGDLDSADRLEAFRRRETVAGLSDAARDAVEAIRARQGKPAPTPEGAEAAKLEALQERLEAVEERLQDLQDRH